jgi:hypothetical protein
MSQSLRSERFKEKWIRGFETRSVMRNLAMFYIGALALGLLSAIAYTAISFAFVPIIDRWTLFWLVFLGVPVTAVAMHLLTFIVMLVIEVVKNRSLNGNLCKATFRRATKAAYSGLGAMGAGFGG